jgi:peptidyl-prolyl cis-trans isomerase C
MENNVLAVVNGKEITQEIFDFTASKFPADKKSHFTTEKGKQDLLDQIVSWELVYCHGKDTGLENNAEYLFQLEEAKKAIIGQLVIQNVLADVKLEENEALEYYNQNLDFFKDPEQVNAKHILVDSQEKAEEVLKQINNGMAFEEAAKQYSSCPSKEQGGSLGEFSRGMMVPEFEDAAFTAEIGVVTAPVKTQFGFHLIRVEGKQDPKAKSFEEVKDMINGHMLQEKQNHTYMNFVNDLKSKYAVETK